VKPLLIGVFASGRGSNFASIVKAKEEGRLSARICLLVTNNPEAGALGIAAAHGIPAKVIAKETYGTREQFVEAMLSSLREHEVEWIALCGYMKKIPSEVIAAFPGRILNIHPALLPSFGGKGMYGLHVHEAVIASGCKVSGVTVHVVDEQYDHGAIVAQKCVVVEEGDTPADLAERVLHSEHELYPQVLQTIAEGRVRIEGQRAFINKK
jgi:formyltetrahydrofolate-dependent phosphoribosylglycinamide formyltransferase